MGNSCRYYLLTLLTEMINLYTKMITFHGKVNNKLNHVMKKIRCLPNVNITDVMPISSIDFFAYGINKIIGSCIFCIMHETIEIFWNIQLQWHSEFYGITNSDSLNTSVFIPKTMNAVYILTP